MVSHLVNLGEQRRQHVFSGYLVELHTLDNDKHLFQCDLPQPEFEKMERVLARGL